MPVRPALPGLLLSLLALLAGGWVAAGTPFHGDQALFLDYAERMSGGAVLYRDLWDVTNPGVFWFYRLAGTLFGFGEDGVHLLEWLWWAGFVLAVGFAAKRAHALPHWPVAPAVLVGGVYFLTSASDPSHLTRAEGLAAFPLFLSAWLACVAVEGPRPRGWVLALAGAAGGVAALFKLAFAACVLAGWLPAVLLTARRQWWKLPALPLGVAAPLALAAGHFACNAALPDALRCLFVTPREVLAVAALAGFDRLARSARWCAEVYSPVLAVAFAGAFAALARRVDPPVIALGLVVFAAGPVVLVQRWSWWSYHFLLVGVPAAVLAAYCWPVLVRAVADRLGRAFTVPEKLAGGVVGLTLFLPALGHGGHAAVRLAGHGWGLTAESRAAARLAAGGAYEQAAEETAWLRGPDAPPGAMFVAGDPLFHTLSGRPAATRIHGWSLELLTPDLWAELVAELKAARPAAVFVDAGVQHYDRLIDAKCPDLRAWLTAEYAEARRSEAGVWYVRKP